MHETLLPDWAQQFIVSEELFTSAYAQVSLQEKTRLKKCIAGLQTWYDHVKIQACSTQIDYCQGLQTWTREQPRDWVLVQVEAESASPAVLLATILPPVLAGVSEVVICSNRDTIPYPASFLTACELSGLETVLNCPDPVVKDLLKDMHRLSPNGALIALHSGSPANGFSGIEMDTSTQVPVYRLRGPRTAGLWIDDVQDWDFEALAFAHPELEIHVWSGHSLQLPVSWPSRRGTIQEFRQAGYDALFVPDPHLKDSRGWAPVILGSGQEGTWVWPEFCRTICLCKQLAWHDPGVQDDYLPEPE